MPREADAVPADGLAETVEGLVPAAAGVPLVAERITVDMPVEFYVRAGADGRPRIETTAPTQRIVTSVLPVFHRVRVRLRLAGEEDGALGRTQ